MDNCRICRTHTNLKYAPKQLSRLRAKQSKKVKIEILDESASTLGNICYECEDRLLNFHKHDNLDLEADSGCEQTPVIVDDDEMLYSQYFDKLPQYVQQLQFTTKQHHTLQSHSLSSDCDTEVIEVLTSRESTPNIKVCKEKTITIIDLADENSNLMQEFNDMCKTDTIHKATKCNKEHLVTTLKTQAVNILFQKRKRRKKFDDKKMILLAEVNLVSSDTDSEDIYAPTKRNKIYEPAHTINVIQKQKQVKREIQLNKQIVKLEKTVVEQKPITTESDFEVNVRDRVKCPVCKLVFSCNQRLVHHMRIRHRSNEQDTQLRERGRHAQDSALTIRLCYQESHLYYECQLCGRIDCIFKEHKEHVIAKHSAELISLKDPLLKRLHCLICERVCGSHYLEVCKHLLEVHTQSQYMLHLKEIKRSKQKQIHDMLPTARIYQFYKRKQLFYQCRQCKLLSNSMQCHRRHINEKHALIVEAEQNEMKSSCTTKQQKKVNQMPKNIVATKKIVVDKKKNAAKVVKKQTKALKTKLNALNTKNEKKQQQKLAKASRKGSIVDAPPAKRRRGRPAATANYMSVGVKVKPTIKQIPLQSYRCEYCSEIFQGYIHWNSHYLEKHIDKECYERDKCNMLFMCNAQLQHSKKPHIGKLMTIRNRRKRKNVTGISIDENSNSTKVNCCNVQQHEQQIQLQLVRDELKDDNIEELLETNEDVECAPFVFKGERGMLDLSLNSGILEMKPNIAILDQTSYYIRCMQKTISTYKNGLPHVIF